MSTPFEELLERSKTISDLGSASAVLGWDQETYMPDGAAEVRSEQLATLSALVHQLTVDSKVDTLLESIGDGESEELEDWQQSVVRVFKRDRDQSVKLSEEFVRENAKATALGQHAWKRARAEANFSLFEDPLRRIIDLKRQQVEFYGYEANPYDALINLYEPGMTAATLRPVFDRLKEGTIRILEKIAGSGNIVSDQILFTDFNREAQLEFSKKTVEKLGFDFTTGRVDLSAHPFCTSFGISDVRLTTRVFTDDLRSCMFGLIHEAGHGMYEQGVDRRFERTPLAGGTSMGIHESQSLFWENTIARSRPFWNWAFPDLQKAFPNRLGDLTHEDFYRIVNTIKPSFIRVEADELTYNLHIILRFEIEDELINGRLDVSDVPEVWNQKMEDLLGIRPANDAEGCLQDVHWSFGGQGYFPSYTLGKLYAAMFANAMRNDLTDMDDQIARGEFGAIRTWLHDNIHRWGRSKMPSELVQDICGEGLSETAFLKYIEEKIDDVYSL